MESIKNKQCTHFLALKNVSFSRDLFTVWCCVFVSDLSGSLSFFCSSKNCSTDRDRRFTWVWTALSFWERGESLIPPPSPHPHLQFFSLGLLRPLPSTPPSLTFYLQFYFAFNNNNRIQEICKVFSLWLIVFAIRVSDRPVITAFS